MQQEPPRHPLHNNIIKFYNSRAPTYDTEDTFHTTLAYDFIKWAAGALTTPLTSPLKMLDLCCGTGLVAHAARAHFGPSSIIHGIDISSVSLDIARAKTDSPAMDTEGNGEMQFYEASATDLDGLTDASGAPLLKKGTYSLITCCSAFVFLPSAPTLSARAAILSTWATYLRPDGILIFDVPAPATQVATLHLSRSLSAYGVPTVDRDWIAGAQSIKEVIEEAEGLELTRVFETGAYKSREYGTREEEELDGLWERLSGIPVSGVEGLGRQEREGARRSFMGTMRAASGEEGVLRDEYRLLVGIGANCE